ncbi:MAG: hypothetical protein BWY82_02861 [Verrucomicrobia bacterium ADurb.Bin474]|nr:MAG: hypothetical protein BWY82_02861 [Verrucomicrobia bacterium ADurb.Bin474]
MRSVRAKSPTNTVPFLSGLLELTTALFASRSGSNPESARSDAPERQVNAKKGESATGAKGPIMSAGILSPKVDCNVEIKDWACRCSASSVNLADATSNLEASSLPEAEDPDGPDIPSPINTQMTTKGPMAHERSKLIFSISVDEGLFRITASGDNPKVSRKYP